MPRGWLISPQLRTGIMIRNILMERGQASPYEVWKEIERRFEGLDYVTPSYLSVSTLFWIMKKINLIETVGKAPSKGFISKTLYRIVSGRENAWEWENSSLAKYNPSKFWKTRTTERPLVTYESPPIQEMVDSRRMKEKLAEVRAKKYKKGG